MSAVALAAWLACGAAVVLALLVGLARRLHTPGGPEIPDPYRPIPDDQNAWPLLQAVCDRIRPPISPRRAREILNRIRDEQREERPSRGWWDAMAWTPGLEHDARISRLYGRGEAPRLEAVGQAIEMNTLDDPALARWEGLYGELLTAVEAALERPGLVIAPPEVDAYWDVNWERRASSLGDLLHLFALRGRRRLGRGDSAGGLHDLLLPVTVADRMVLAGDTAWRFDFALWAWAELANALGPRPAGLEGDPTEAWPTAGWTTGQQSLWREALERLDRSARDPRLVEAYHAADHHRCVRRLPAGHWLRPARWGRTVERQMRFGNYDLRRTLWLHRRVTTEVIRQGRREPREREPECIAAAARDVPRLRRFNRSGQAKASSYAAGALERLLLQDQALHQRRLVALAIALKLFHERNGRMPREWDELVADGILSEVPLDPFDGEPVRFDPRGGLLYFVGPRWEERDADARWDALRHYPPQQRPSMESRQGRRRRDQPHAMPLTWIAKPSDFAG